MAVEVEHVPLDQRRRRVVTDAITEARILTMMDEVVVDVMPFTAGQIDRRMAEPRYLTVIDFQARMSGRDTIGRGKQVVILMAASLGE